jgi:hypothetical protein
MSVPAQTRLEVLKAARERISDKKHWTKGQAARDSQSHPVDPSSPKACRWCLNGSIMRECTDRDIEQWWDVAREITPPQMMSNIYFNDNASHEGVLALVDQTISRLTNIGDREKIRYTE